jgi:hypothetical protein
MIVERFKDNDICPSTSVSATKGACFRMDWSIAIAGLGPTKLARTAVDSRGDPGILLSQI